MSEYELVPQHEQLRKESPLNLCAMISPNSNMVHVVAKISLYLDHLPMDNHPILHWRKYSCWLSKIVGHQTSY
ncbi:hypothetical protein E2562_007823 [Oryza meyeriana var. granulata]|uniref:Uncharacterized protein n=1 Tax=Oryza meyeriana var. granulata TaxID=110450 RepID=A0A6G1F575_9ORYZ|nr:hypothetical protein E2562_007823 [Oryza meyeriana var. granulata]